MTGLDEIRALFAVHYFSEPVFVAEMHLVVTVEARIAMPTGDGRGVWPETYLFSVEAEIKGRRCDYAQLIWKEKFDLTKGIRSALVNEVWDEMRNALLKAREERDALLSG